MEYIRKQDVIGIVGKPYKLNTDRIKALQSIQTKTEYEISMGAVTDLASEIKNRLKEIANGNCMENDKSGITPELLKLSDVENIINECIGMANNR